MNCGSNTGIDSIRMAQGTMSQELAWFLVSALPSDPAKPTRLSPVISLLPVRTELAAPASRCPDLSAFVAPALVGCAPANGLERFASGLRRYRAKLRRKTQFGTSRASHSQPDTLRGFRVCPASHVRFCRPNNGEQQKQPETAEQETES
jgi:hypothetical protein